MRAASALFLRAENGPQQPPQNPRRLPDNDPHAPPLLSSQARSHNHQNQYGKQGGATVILFEPVSFHRYSPFDVLTVI